jgi:hypothetical protein
VVDVEVGHMVWVLPWYFRTTRPSQQFHYRWTGLYMVLS